MKKVWTLFLAAALAFVLTACASGGPAPGETTESGDGSRVENADGSQAADGDRLWFVGRWVPVGQALGDTRFFTDYRAELEETQQTNTNPTAQEKCVEELAEIDMLESMYFQFDMEPEALEEFAPTARMTGLYVPTGPLDEETVPVLHEGDETKLLSLEEDGGLRLDNVHAYPSDEKYPDHPGYMIITLGYSGVSDLILEKVEG